MVPFPVAGLTELIHDGAPVILHDVQLVVTVNDVVPLDELTVILAGETLSVGAAVILTV